LAGEETADAEDAGAPVHPGVLQRVELLRDHPDPEGRLAGGGVPDT